MTMLVVEQITGLHDGLVAAWQSLPGSRCLAPVPSLRLFVAGPFGACPGQPRRFGGD